MAAAAAQLLQKKKTYDCLVCKAPIKLARKDDGTGWDKFNLDGSPHLHPNRKNQQPQPQPQQQQRACVCVMQKKVYSGEKATYTHNQTFSSLSPMRFLSHLAPCANQDSFLSEFQVQCLVCSFSHSLLCLSYVPIWWKSQILEDLTVPRLKRK